MFWRYNALSSNLDTLLEREVSLTVRDGLFDLSLSPTGRGFLTNKLITQFKGNPMYFRSELSLLQ